MILDLRAAAIHAELRLCEDLDLYDVPQQAPNLYRLARDTLRRNSLDADEANRATEQDILHSTLSVALAFGRSHPAVLDVAAIILGRLAHFPAIEALRRRFPSWTPRIPIASRLGNLGRIAAHTVGPEDVPLTPFQMDLYQALQGDSVSISAPTSAGKSFVLARVVAKLASEGQVVVYLVPTRALIREVTSRIRKELVRMDAPCPIRNIPIPFPDIYWDSGRVFVLTQERFLALVGKAETPPQIDVFIVDEAHEIESSKRGVLMDAAIEWVRRQEPRPKTLFTAPRIQNPEELLNSIVHGKIAGLVHTDDRSPVMHNFLHAKCGQGRVDLTLHVDEHVASVGAFEPALPLLFHDLPYEEKIRHVAIDLATSVHTYGSATLLYCNGPDKVEAIADELHSQRDPMPQLDPDLQSLIDWVSKEIHPNHPLVAWLERGIGVHHGKMPAIVRVRMEELAVRGALEFICCTSTLLHGVNLPCKHIIIVEQGQGRGRMSDAAFANLAGRAGRLSHDIVGNIWTISLESQPESRIQPGEPAPIKNVVAESLAHKPAQLTREWTRENRVGGSSLTQALASRTYELNALGHNWTTSIPDASNATLAKLRVHDERLNEFRQRHAELTAIFLAHPGVAPQRIADLYQDMINLNERDVVRLLPSPARLTMENAGAYIASVAPYLAWHLGSKIYFYDDADETPSFPRPLRKEEFRKAKETWKVAQLAPGWLNDLPLGKLLQEAINRARYFDREIDSNRAKIGRVVRKAVGRIDEGLRYDFSRYWHVLEDLLEHYFAHRLPRPDYVQQIQPLHLYLELGTKNEATMDLLSLGFSRSGAAIIRKAMRTAEFSYGDNPEAVLAWVAKNAASLPTWEDISYEIAIEICTVAGLSTEHAAALI